MSRLVFGPIAVKRRRKPSISRLSSRRTLSGKLPAMSESDMVRNMVRQQRRWLSVVTCDQAGQFKRLM